MANEFVPNPEFARELQASGELEPDLLEIALSIAENAKSLAPVMHGDYRDAIHADGGEETGEYIGRVNADNYKSNWIEFGTGEPYPTAAFASLRRGAEQAGYRVTGGKEHVSGGHK